MTKPVKVRILKGRYQSREINDLVVPLIKPLQEGKIGHFLTVPNIWNGNSAKARVKCKPEHVEYLDEDENVIENVPVLPASSATGQADPRTVNYLETGVMVDEQAAANNAKLTHQTNETHVEDEHLKTLTDDEAMDFISQRFGMMARVVDMIAKGHNSGLVVYGAAGVGKTYSVTEKLEEHKMMGEFVGTLGNKGAKMNYEEISGVCSPLHLYKKLYENSEHGQVLLMDDADGILFDQDSLNILKAALDTTGKRTISWMTESNVLKKEGIPNQFDYNGSVIFLTNINFGHSRSAKLNAHLDAIKSRCIYFDMLMSSAKSQILRIRQVIRDGMLEKYELDDETQVDILDYVIANQTYLQETSLRMVVKIAKIAMADPEHWKELADNTCLKREAYFMRLKANRENKELEQAPEVPSFSLADEAEQQAAAMARDNADNELYQ